MSIPNSQSVPPLPASRSGNHEFFLWVSESVSISHSYLPPGTNRGNSETIGEKLILLIYLLFSFSFVVVVLKSIPSSLSEKGGPWQRWTLLLRRRPCYVSVSLVSHLTLVYLRGGGLTLTWAESWGAEVTPKAASLSVLSFEKSILALVFRFLCVECALNKYLLTVVLKCGELGNWVGRKKGDDPVLLSAKDPGHLKAGKK